MKAIEFKIYGHTLAANVKEWLFKRLELDRPDRLGTFSVSHTHPSDQQVGWGHAKIVVSAQVPNDAPPPFGDGNKIVVAFNGTEISLAFGLAIHLTISNAGGFVEAETVTRWRQYARNLWPVKPARKTGIQQPSEGHACPTIEYAGVIFSLPDFRTLAKDSVDMLAKALEQSEARAASAISPEAFDAMQARAETAEANLKNEMGWREAIRLEGRKIVAERDDARRERDEARRERKELREEIKRLSAFRDGYEFTKRRMAQRRGPSIEIFDEVHKLPQGRKVSKSPFTPSWLELFRQPVGKVIAVDTAKGPDQTVIFSIANFASQPVPGYCQNSTCGAELGRVGCKTPHARPIGPERMLCKDCWYLVPDMIRKGFHKNMDQKEREALFAQVRTFMNTKTSGGFIYARPVEDPGKKVKADLLAAVTAQTKARDALREADRNVEAVRQKCPHKPRVQSPIPGAGECCLDCGAHGIFLKVNV